MTVASLFLATVVAQPQPADWRRIGTITISSGLASPAGGSVERVWFGSSGTVLYAKTAKAVWQTSDFETWTAAPADVQPVGTASTVSTSSGQTGRWFRGGSFAWRSDDSGRSWANLTEFDGRSILGGELVDIAVSPVNPEEVVVAGENGVWRSVDAGASWSGLNENLPNLPVERILTLPQGSDPSVRVLLRNAGEALWSPGERGGWRLASDSVIQRESLLKSAVPVPNVTAVARSADTMYAGTSEGRLLVSTDRGRTWREAPAIPAAGRIVRVATDPRDERFAIAITSTKVLRTNNAGAFWDDVTADLPAGEIHGVTTDRITGAVYVASDAGIFMTYTDPLAAAPATSWTRLREEPARDVMLDASGNQLYAGLNGRGVWATMAPHRLRDPRVVSAGDRILRAASPGSLLSVIGARIQSARAGDMAAAVLASGEHESQVQLPWDLSGSAVMVSLQSAGGNRIQLGVPLSAASPSIFVDRDGEPLLTSADTGLVLDAATPARSHTRVQILVSGLGKVTPNWPMALPAPLEDPPKVLLPVRAWLDRESLQVSRATLAPGYTGLYLVEIQLPSIVNRGPAELYIEAGNAQSNRVRIWLEP